MEVSATAKYLRVSPKKLRRSVDLIRGRHVDDARRILRLSALGPNQTLSKVLESAVANAEQRQAIPENLVVARAWVDEGPTLRRWRPRAYGRATKIRKRTSHVTVVVQTLGEVAEEMERASGGTQG
jgi:large subunit ribosomal protein L22